MPAKSAAISTFATCSFGSILPDNDWVRVNAQLIDAPINASLWAERFDNLGAITGTRPLKSCSGSRTAC
jgi:hypothetical protein